VTTPRTASHHGILNPDSGRAHFRLTRHEPADDLAPWVERHWVVRWDLRGREPHLQETLPHPCVNMVVEDGHGRAFGVGTERAGRLLEGRGEAVGTKFRPGAFAPFSPLPVADLTDDSRPLEELFGPEGDRLGTDMLAAPDDRERIELVEAFLRRRLPAPDPKLHLVTEVVAAMLASPADTRVDDLTSRFALSSRTLQRLFRAYVGVSPKWVLKRYRLHEAAERIARGETDLPGLALDLGYFDQAHFSNDFKALVGRSPAGYAEECARRAALAA
jgi:AraC-like DNA-binding protein